MHRTIIVGSPRENGRCGHLAEELFEACVEECPEDGISLVSVAGMEIAPCIGCDGCEEPIPPDSERYPEIPEKGDPLRQNPLIYKSDANGHQCVFADDMKDVRKHIDAADELIVVAPVYFAGAPAQMKALLDRLQPYYWSNVRTRTSVRRPLTLHVIGEGDDPIGFQPLIDTTRAACAVAGFRLERVLDWVGRIDADGTITADAEEVSLHEP